MRLAFTAFTVMVFSILTACEANGPRIDPAIFDTPERISEDATYAEFERATLRSPHFTLYANMPPLMAQKLLEDLETLRIGLRDAHNVSSTAPDIHLEILVVDDFEDFLAFAPGESSAAFYSLSALGPKIVINASDALWDTETLWDVMYHEYAHHFNATYLDYKTPLWLNEGLATYAESFRVTGVNTYEFGYVDKTTYELLRQNLKDWLPTETFIMELKKYPIIQGYYGEHAQKRQAFYYAQSWLIAYWMHHTDEGRKTHIELIKRLDKGEDIRPAFPENIHDILQDYVKHFSPEPRHYKSVNAEIFAGAPIDKAPLSEIDITAQLYLQVSQDGGGETYEATLSKLRQVLEKDPDYKPYISAMRSLKLYNFKRYVAARQLMNNAARAKEGDPNLQRLNAIFNISMIPNFSRVPFFDAQDLRTHKAHIDKVVQRAIKARPGDIALDIERLHALGRYSQNLSDDQKLSLDRVLSSNHHKRNPILSLSLVYPLIAQKKFDEADEIVQRAQLWADAKDLKDIEGMKEDIRLNRKYATETDVP